MKIKEIAQELRKFRDENNGQKYAYLFTKDDLVHAGIHITGYDGIRVYMGTNGDKNTAYAVAVKKDGTGKYNDVLQNGKKGELSEDTSIVKGRPCPTMCGSTNILNE